MSLNSALLLLLGNFVSGFRLELMYVSHIVNIRSNLTHLRGYQQFVLMSLFIEFNFIICTNRIYLLNLKQSSNRLVITTKVFLKLSNLYMLLKHKSPSNRRNLAVGTFGKLLIVFSTKVNLPDLLYLTDRRCCLLHLIKQNYFLKTFLITLILMTLVSLYLFSLRELI